MKVILVICLLLCFSCNSKQSHDNFSGEDIGSAVENSKLDSGLEKLIENYIQKYDGMFTDKEWLYYNVFLFSDNHESLVTIWTNTYFPDVFFSESSISYTYSMFKVKKRNVIFISNTNSSKEFHDMIPVRPENQDNANAEMKKEYGGPIYDGDMFFETYRINKVDGGYNFDKLEKAKASFLNPPPPDEYLH